LDWRDGNRGIEITSSPTGSGYSVFTTAGFETSHNTLKITAKQRTERGNQQGNEIEQRLVLGPGEGGGEGDKRYIRKESHHATKKDESAIKGSTVSACRARNKEERTKRLGERKREGKYNSSRKRGEVPTTPHP
jgi:hypothetical protein